MPKLNAKVFGNVRTVFSGATPREKTIAIREIGYCAVGVGLFFAAFASLISSDSWFGTVASSSPIVAAIVGGVWAAIKS